VTERFSLCCGFKKRPQVPRRLLPDAIAVKRQTAKDELDDKRHRQQYNRTDLPRIVTPRAHHIHACARPSGRASSRRKRRAQRIAWGALRWINPELYTRGTCTHFPLHKFGDRVASTADMGFSRNRSMTASEWSRCPESTLRGLSSWRDAYGRFRGTAAIAFVAAVDGTSLLHDVS
jgi:hypothetical protein